MKAEKALQEARTRGALRGSVDKAHDYYNPAPLSGEWAGESIPELLGDLFGDGDGDWVDALCEAYEEGYNEANDIPVDID